MEPATPAPAEPHDAVRDAFAQVETWVFDLDNTLYPPERRLFDQIEDRISAFVMRELGVDRAEADRLRHAYWHDHGTTLAGLMMHHGIDPDPFLEEVHRIDFSVLTPDPALRAAIAALPGRRIVYTNGTAPYARKVAEALELDGLFDAFYGVKDAFYTPKPEPGAFQRIFGADGLNPRRAAMFEDDVRNLRAPCEMGLQTVWVAPGAEERPAPTHVRFRTSDLAGFLRRLV
jgi:putative hydrolase of the HAD superfamily